MTGPPPRRTAPTRHRRWSRPLPITAGATAPAPRKRLRATAPPRCLMRIPKSWQVDPRASAPNATRCAVAWRLRWARRSPRRCTRWRAESLRDARAPGARRSSRAGAAPLPEINLADPRSLFGVDPAECLWRDGGSHPRSAAWLSLRGR